MASAGNSSHSDPSKWIVRFAVLLVVTAVLVIVLAWYLWADWVPTSTLVRLEGASADEVRLMLGEPDTARDYRWYYRRPLRLAEFRVDFDGAGKVIGYSYDR